MTQRDLIGELVDDLKPFKKQLLLRLLVGSRGRGLGCDSLFAVGFLFRGDLV